MLVERNVLPGRVEIIGEAYDIAAYYLAMTGMIPAAGDRLRAVPLRRPQQAAARQQGDHDVRAQQARVAPMGRLADRIGAPPLTCATQSRCAGSMPGQRALTL
jgi:hypothetical protein